VVVPWSGFDLINAFNAWRKTEDAGRVFVVAADGTITKRVTGLAWRHEVSAQVFEEAAIDLSRALAAYSRSRSGSRKGQRVDPEAQAHGTLPRQLPAPQQPEQDHQQPYPDW
jgi:putative transposase